MKREDLERILGQHNFGVAYLAHNFRVVHHNSRFGKFVRGETNLQNKPLPALIPEAVGLEAIFEKLAAGERVSFTLENINRETTDRKRIYFNIHLYHLGSNEAPVLCLLEDVTEKARLIQQVTHQKNEIRLLEGMLSSRSDEIPIILGNSEPIRKVKNTIEKISNITTTTVLLQGETGTGKSMVARMIHHRSLGTRAPFVEINCAAIPETLLESELFGYEKGAFTHAMESKTGLLEAAQGGTLFLDEIGDMPLPLQAKLLSFLETWRFRRLGSTRERKVQLRLITATNQNLYKLVEEKKFREDLFYRLNVVHIVLPPLREMGEDVLEIAEHFIQRFNLVFKKRIKGLSGEARAKLLSYQWRGNVRELRNVLERAMIFAEGEVLEGDFLQLGPTASGESPGSLIDTFRLPPEGIPLEEIEKKLLQNALQLSNGNQSKAAQLLHLSRDTFRYRLEKYHLI